MNNIDTKKNIDEMLRKIAKEIEISETEHQKAEKSYNAVGEYINNNIPQYDIRVIPQGSFRLGTVIKPINDKEEYDIDLVVIVNNKFQTAKELKNIIGDVLKSSERYSRNLTEGKRCWTIEYSESAHYHMDILPTMKSNSYNVDKKLMMTHKENLQDEYKFMVTNPEAYFDWFCRRMEEERKKLKRDYAIRNKMEIVEVPDYKIKTTLQVAIEILKRYRDVKFKDNSENKPISIILTTIISKIYTGNESVYELIEKFSNEYMFYLQKDTNGKIRISNPVNEEENFADKWTIYPEREFAFFQFMSDLKEDIVSNRLLTEGDFVTQGNIYKRLFGENAVNRVYESMANETRVGREQSNIYISDNGNITAQKTETPIRNHNFFGK